MPCRRRGDTCPYPLGIRFGYPRGDHLWTVSYAAIRVHPLADPTQVTAERALPPPVF